MVVERVRWTGLFAALVAGTWLLTLSPASDSRSATPTLESVWARATRGSVSGTLPDGTTYTPAFFLDAGTSVGSALSTDGGSVRLVVVRGSGNVRELRRLPAEAAPQFHGFVAGEGRLAWAESVADARGTLTTSMWVMAADGTGAGRRIAADAGDVRQTDSAYELSIADGRLHWTAVAGESTEVRSVSLDGTGARTTSVPGLWSPVAWPWLLDSSDVIGGGRVRLMDRVRNVTQQFVAGQTEFPECGATWCRAIVMDDDQGNGRIDLMRIDGTQRREIARADAGFPVSDVAVLDRFEFLTDLTPATRAQRGRPLSIYDIARGGAVRVASDAVSVLCRGGYLWWSSGFDDRLAWHVIDLRTLS
ncbi:hypothetical protein DFJ67_5455 [Asanoa ferruginea]|uniref:Uncharacterized protein n=1 Tax=Asanoa ferruginea TaxID=53367 RepID=A0A3D9ZRB1_9ACTN|nr:hypothetical protein [Asanoa ferruginea]REF99419.1 hypothetical protein DFJ67_5455 [Asanoa ferruginea]GIF46023.1 hypothetical protein Afe04nite_05620 [Asanoa ferruginea]